MLAERVRGLQRRAQGGHEASEEGKPGRPCRYAHWSRAVRPCAADEAAETHGGGPAAPFVGAPVTSSDIPDLTERLPPGKLGGLLAEGAVSTPCAPSIHCCAGGVSPGDTKAWAQEHPGPPTTDGAVRSTCCMMKTRSSRPNCTTGFREQRMSAGPSSADLRRKGGGARGLLRAGCLLWAHSCRRSSPFFCNGLPSVWRYYAAADNPALVIAALQHAAPACQLSH